ncbi:hypothetical protein, partial [Martelella sp. AMO21009]
IVCWICAIVVMQLRAAGLPAAAATADRPSIGCDTRCHQGHCCTEQPLEELIGPLIATPANNPKHALKG